MKKDIKTKYRLLPVQHNSSTHDIYLRKINGEKIPVQQRRQERKLFIDNQSFITVHAQGNRCIFDAVRLCVEFVNKFRPWVKTYTTTSTETVSCENIDGTVSSYPRSAIHIMLIRDSTISSKQK